MLEFDEKDPDAYGLGIALILKYEPDTNFYFEYGYLWVGDYKVTYSQMTDEEKALIFSRFFHFFCLFLTICQFYYQHLHREIRCVYRY